MDLKYSYPFSAIFQPYLMYIYYLFLYSRGCISYKKLWFFTRRRRAKICITGRRLLHTLHSKFLMYPLTMYQSLIFLLPSVVVSFNAAHSKVGFYRGVYADVV